MAWYPGARKLELQPESDAQVAIKPTQFILHSIAAPWTVQRIYEYWRDSTNLESHFGLAYDGDLGQFIGTHTRADANASANVRAVSLESASNLEHTDPWTDKQLEAIVKLGVWLHATENIPLRICRAWDDPGYGYHGMFPEWSLGGTACPGAARIAQFKNYIFPEIVRRASGALTPTPVEDDMPTADEIAAAVWNYRLTNYGNLDSNGKPKLQPAGDFQLDQDRKFSLLNDMLQEILKNQAGEVFIKYEAK